MKRSLFLIFGLSSLAFAKGKLEYCKHPDDDRASGHTITLCGKRIPGHGFEHNDAGTANTCADCERGHTASPNLCKITAMDECTAQESSSQEGEGYTPKVIRIRK
jgi:hypothetical protein